MRHYEFIREYSRDKTVENWGRKIAARVEQDRTLRPTFKDIKEPEQITKFVADFVIEPLERADPTKNNQYVQNLIKFYIAGEQLEDLKSTAVEYLTKFHKLKAKKQIPSPRNDINRYANFGDFASVIDEYPDPEEKQEAPKGEAKEVYKDANVRIITPEDTEAACYYGQGTRWCTAATKGQNAFDYYNKEGPMYILIPTKPQYNGEKYQIHPASRQFMNQNDERAGPTKIMARFGEDFTAWLRKTVPNLEQILQDVEFFPDNDKLESAWQDLGKIVNDMLLNEYNSIANDRASIIREVAKMSADEIRNLASRYQDFDASEEVPTLTKLATVYSWAVSNELGPERTGLTIEDEEALLEDIRSLEVRYKDGNLTVIS
jgi:hypothetical protein